MSPTTKIRVLLSNPFAFSAATTRPTVASISSSVSANRLLRLLAFWNRLLWLSGTCTWEKGMYAKKGVPAASPPGPKRARKDAAASPYASSSAVRSAGCCATKAEHVAPRESSH